MTLKGSIETIPVISIIQLLCDEKKSGMLRLMSGKQQVKFFFQDGKILCVMGSLEKARLGYLLRNSDLISEVQLSECLDSAMKKNQVLGKILLDYGYISPRKLKAIVQKQAAEIIFNLLQWKNGTFEYRDGKIKSKDLVVTSINIMGIILDALRRKDELDFAEQEKREKESEDAADKTDEKTQPDPAPVPVEHDEKEIVLNPMEWEYFWK